MRAEKLERCVPNIIVHISTTRLQNSLGLVSESEHDQALEKAVAKQVNPFETPVVLSTGNTPAWTTFSIGYTPTLTKSHCEAMCFWCSSKGGYLDLQDLWHARVRKETTCARRADSRTE